MKIIFASVIAEPISFTGRLTLQDFLEMHRFHFRVVIRRSIRWAMAFMSLLFTGLIIFAGMQSHFTFLSFCGFAFFAYFPFGWLLLRGHSLKRNYIRNQDKFIEHTVTFTNESISTASVKADSRLDWDQLSSVIATPRGLLFLVQPHRIWFWLPQHFFGWQRSQGFRP